MKNPKEEKCTCKEHDPYCCKIHGNCPTCVKKEKPKQENCNLNKKNSHTQNQQRKKKEYPIVL